MFELIKTGVSYVFIFLLFVVSLNGQSCSNGSYCQHPQDMSLNSTSSVDVSVSSYCNGTFILYNGGTDTCNPNFKQNLLDKAYVPGTVILDGVYTTSWTSVTTLMSDGTYSPQSILINFTDIFLITDIKITFSTPSNSDNDMRPNAMEILGFDVNSNSWRTWFYFDVDCNNKGPICERKIGNVPNPGQYVEVSFSIGNTYGDAMYQNESIQRLYMTSAVQIKLKTPAFTNNANLSYYTVSDITLNYQCACFGHASECAGASLGICKCQHNTAGNNCEQCLPLYNNVTWQMASISNSFECQACNCNNRSQSCNYNPLEMSGTCSGCLYGTSGKYCEQCAIGYYINPTGDALAAPVLNCTGFDGNVTQAYNCLGVCIPCNCSTVGSTDFGLSCNYTGYCNCKSRVMGRTCDSCVDGSFNLQSTSFEGCSACDCDARGIITCDRLNGTCICKSNTTGARCDSCQPGFYNLSSNDPAGCSYCNCDVGASSSRVCDALSGTCPCKPYTTTRTCASTFDGFFGPRLDFYTFEAEYSVNVSVGDIVERVGGGSDGSTFTGRGFLNIIPPKALIFNARVLTSAWYQPVVRYESTLQVDVTATFTPITPVTTSPTYLVCQNFTSNTATGTIVVKDNSGYIRLTGPVCLVGNIDYELKLDLPFAPAGIPGSGILLDSIVLFPVIDNLTSFMVNNDSIKAQIRQCYEADMVVSSGNRSILGCPAVDYSLMIDLQGGAYACYCNSQGSFNQSCQPIGGQCYCKPNIFLRNCSQCSVFSYGFNAATGCIACGCHPNASVTLKCNETGLCQCKTNVTGDKCDRCIDKTFGLTTGAGCQPCLCSVLYVVNDSCMDSGQCFCKPGVSGVKCTVCSPGYYGLTTSGCSACRCNALGSMDSSCDSNTGACRCRSQVTGFLCDTCKPGYFGLSPYSSDGCIQCYCSGKSQNCSSALGWYQAFSIFKPNLITPIAFEGAWTGASQNGTSVPVELDGALNISDLYWKITNNDGSNWPLYFVSPNNCSTTSCFNGFKASSYGQWLNITLSFNQYAPPTPAGGPLLTPFQYPEGDVIIKSSNVSYILVTSLNVSSPNLTTYSIRMNETSWFKDKVSAGVHPTYGEMIQLLYNVANISIRAKFSETNGSTTSLASVVLGYGVNDPNSGQVPLSNVEQCVCPPTYEGRFCGRCSAGYTKVNNQCVLCSCNGHVYPGTNCDPYTGKCTCTHNTMGDNCNQCMPGYYGNAQGALPDSCKSCMCPGNVNDPSALFHSPSKTCNTTGSTFTCNCDIGYSGSKCDSCGYGYYGSPYNSSINGGVCTPCLCGDCDNVTGVCRSCPSNTAGVECSQCLPNFFSATPVDISKICTACSCNQTGSAAPCVNTTGTCVCQPGVDPSTNCSACLPEYYNFTSAGCIACNCNFQFGTINANKTCSSSGQCSCNSNFLGLTCNQCIDQKYGNDCNSNCSCSTNYTINGNNSCSKEGRCQCLYGFGGLSCNTCYRNESLPGSPQTSLQDGNFPNCTSCGPCFKSLAGKVDIINQNMSDVLGMMNDLFQRNFGSISPSDYSTRINTMSLPLNKSQLDINMLIFLKQNLSNISYYDVPARLAEYDASLQSLYANQTNLTTRTTNLDNVDPNILNTGDINNPQISLPNINISFNSIVSLQSRIFSDGEAAFKSIQFLDSLVQNQQSAVDGLRSRVETINGTMSRSNLSLTNSLNQMNNISISTLQSKLTAADQRMKSTETLVNSLSSDLNIAQYYLTNTISLHNVSKDQLDAFTNQYNIWNQQLSATGPLQNFSSIDLRMAQDAANSASRYCNITQSLNDSVTTSLINLSTAKNQIETSNLTRNVATMNSINSASIDPYSIQIGSVIASIDSASVQPELIADLSRSADNSSAIAQSLTGVIQNAVNRTQQAQTKLNQLLSNMNLSSNLDSQAKTCLNSNTAQISAITTNVNSVSQKANETRIAADATSQAMLNATSMFTPVKNAFANISSSILTSGNSLQLVNNTLYAIQSNELRNSNNMVLLNSNYSNRLSEYSTWLTTKTQVESCLNDLWTSLGTLNRPVKLTDLATQTQSQLSMITQLTTDITNLENEINAVMLAINSFGPENAACTEATAG